MSDEDRQKWDERYSRGEHARGQAPGWLRELDGEIPFQGLALDVAAGTGRVALWLARRGLEVIAADISPVGLALARETAADEGVRIVTKVVDFERQGLPEGRYDVVACFHYRQRSLFPTIRESLTSGGVVMAELPTVKNLERNETPSLRWLAEENELLKDLAGLTVLYYREGWFGNRHVARMVARKA